MNEYSKEIKNALEFYNKIQYFFQNGIERFPQNIKIGSFSVDKDDDVREQYELILDYFQEEGMNLTDIDEDYEKEY